MSDELVKMEIRRDGHMIASREYFTADVAILGGASLGHRMFSSSWDWAQRHEGYTLWIKEPLKDWRKIDMRLTTK